MKEYSQYVILNFHIMKLLIFAFQILDLSIGYNLISTYIFSLNPSSSTQESTDYIYKYVQYICCLRYSRGNCCHII